MKELQKTQQVWVSVKTQLNAELPECGGTTTGEEPREDVRPQPDEATETETETEEDEIPPTDETEPAEEQEPEVTEDPGVEAEPPMEEIPTPDPNAGNTGNVGTPTTDPNENAGNSGNVVHRMKIQMQEIRVMLVRLIHLKKSQRQILSLQWKKHHQRRNQKQHHYQKKHLQLHKKQNHSYHKTHQVKIL